MKFAYGALLGILLSLVVGEGHARTWKNKEGKSIEAEAVSKTDKTVTLKLSNGETRTIEIRTLSLDDQSFLSSWTPPLPKRPIGVPEKATYHNGSWYHVVHADGGWKMARQKAEKMGGQLAVIKDEETNRMIKELADGLLVWIGATDEEVDGLWTWVDGEKVTFKHWGAGEPNGGRKENYMRLGKKGFWIDVNEKGGGNRPVGFIVQWKG